MVRKKGNPGCPCCCSCDLDSVAGPIEIEGADTKTLRTRQHPQSPYSFWLQVEIHGDSSTAIPRLFLAWDSTGTTGICVDFLLDVTTTSGVIRAYWDDGTEIGGSECIKGLVSGEWHPVTICYNPDAYPRRISICIDPPGDYYGDDYPEQCTSIELAADYEAGGRFGYGTAATHSGIVSFRNYDVDRLWYTEDESCAADAGQLCDYYYGQQSLRIACHSCNACGTGPGAWSGAIADSDTQNLVLAGTSGYSLEYMTVTLSNGDQAIFGWSDSCERNKLYAVFSHNASSGSVYVGSIYDEFTGSVFFWFGMPGNYEITYSIMSVTDGGSPAVVSGPTTLTAAIKNGSYWVWGDVSVGTGNKTRKGLYGTGTISNPVSFSAGHLRNCPCGNVSHATKYVGTVAGISSGSTYKCSPSGPNCTLDTTRINFGGTLENYWGAAGPAGFESCIDPCCYNIAEMLYDPFPVVSGSRHIIFVATKTIDDDECYIDLHAWVFASWISTIPLDPCGCIVYVQVHFHKRVGGATDLRSLSNEVLPFADVTYYKSVTIIGEPEYDFVNAEAATFTVSAS